MSLVYLSCAWVAGIFLGSALDLPLVLVFAGLIPFPLVFFARHHRKLIVLASLCLIIFLGGAVYFRSTAPTVDEGHLQFYNGQGTVEIKGLINRDPELGDKTARLYLSAREIKADKGWQKVSGTALVLVLRYPDYRYGDELLVTGRPETPLQLGTSGYRDFLANQEVYSVMSYPKIEVLATGKGFKPMEWIYSLRNRLSQALARVLPEPQASLAQGIILGIRGDIPSSVEAAFVRTGTAHILAISGLNLSIVAGILVSFGIWLFGRKRYIYVWLTLSAIWIYALLTGMHSPVIRAAIMASAFLAAELLGRQRSAFTALSLAAAVMVGINPRILWDASFQLSFLSMAGLVFISPPIQSLARRVVSETPREGNAALSTAHFVTDSFSASLGAIIAVWPLIAYYFGIISWVGLPATLFALLALPAVIITGALAAGLGLVLMPLAQAAGWLVWLFLSYMLLVVKFFDTIPPTKVDSVDIALVWAYYSVLAIAIWLSVDRKRWISVVSKATGLVSRVPKRWVITPLVVLAVLASLTAATMPDGNLHVSFLDVGQGDAILIQRGSREVLVDGGLSPQAVASELGRKMPFWDRTIDLVVLTHPHADHIAGLVEVLRRYKVKQVLYPDLQYDSPLYDEWFELVEEKNIEKTLAQAGRQIKLRDIVIDVLNPSGEGLSAPESELDNNSMVLRLEMGKVSFLLTADIMRDTELKLTTSRANLASTVLKVAHHGSDTSTTDEFLAVVNPQLAVISVGADNKFGLPSNEVVGRLELKLGEGKVYRTDKNGTVEFITDGGKLWVRAGR